MKLENLPLIDIISCYNKSDVARQLNLPINGKSLKLVEQYIELHNISILHFDKQYKNRVYKNVTKECPVCKQEFTTQSGHPKEAITCSYSCSNTHFRSGLNNPNFKNGNRIYRDLITIEQCNRCGYKEHLEILQVHHIDRDRLNNTIENLEVLCPNCHTLDHYQNKDGMFTSKFQNS